MRPIPDASMELVKRWEGLELAAYPDPATGAEPFTIGYGHTRGVKPGQKITERRATQFLRMDLQDAAVKLQSVLPPLIIDDLTDNQYGALLSFVFNVGCNADWTIWKRLKGRQYDQVPGELIKFVNANGKKMQGLVNRRTDEIRVWSTDEPGSENINLTSHVTRGIATPPTPVDPTPAKKSATIWLAITGAAAGFFKWVGDLLNSIPDFAQTALNAINPFAQKSELAQLVANGVGGLAAVAGLYVAWSVVKKKKEQRT